MNYDLEMQKTLEEIKGRDKKPTLLLHSCCAPCSSAVIEKLVSFFDITVFYYNPNIEPLEEYEKRKAEQKRFLNDFKKMASIDFLDADYDPSTFHKVICGLEHELEGGKRCLKCYHLRLEKTAKTAKEHGFNYFCSTLSVSPYKNATVLNAIGAELQEIHHISYLPNDFKKKNGYLRSIQLAKEYELYRQNYCGCIFSKEKNFLD